MRKMSEKLDTKAGEQSKGLVRQAMHICTQLKRSCSCLLMALAILQPVSGHGAYHDVVQKLREQLKTQPDNAALHFKLAQAHVGHEEATACLEELLVVEKLAPGSYPTAPLRGQALFLGGKYEEAKTELDGFLTKNPRHGAALATRGRVLMKLKRPDEAVVDLQNAVKFTSTPEVELIQNLSDVCMQVGKPEMATLTIDEALKTSGDSPALLQMSLVIERETKNWDAALRRIEALQKLAPRPEPWMAERALLLSTAGRTDESRAAWLALRDRLLSLPNLERGSPQNSELLKQARKALGEKFPEPVSIAPKP